MSNDLRSYIRHVINEIVVKIDDEDYDIPEDKVDQLKTFISKKLGVQKFNPEGYLEGLKDYPEAAIEVQSLLKTAYPQDKQLLNVVKKHLSSLYPAEIVAILSDRRPPTGTVTVPEALYDLAEYRTSSTAGKQIGRGELAIPFLFEDAKLSTASNDPYDATISGEKWHVKEAKPSIGVRMGSAKGKSFSDTKIYQQIMQTGIVSPGTLFNVGAADLSKILVQIAGALSSSNAKLSSGSSVESLYDEISRQVTSASLGEAAGVLWYTNGTFTFTPASELGLKYFTQGRAVLSVNSKEQVLGYLTPKPEKTTKKSKAKVTKAEK